MPLNLVAVLMLLGGWAFARAFAFARLPAVLGMVVWGLCLGAAARGKLPPLLFELEPYLKSFALVVILLRAGLGLHKRALAKAGKAAVLMAILPCLLEGAALSVAFHVFFGFDWITSGLTAFMLAAVSPAVIVPSMLNLTERGLGGENAVPTLVLAGASADDVLAITVFSVFLQMATGGDIVVSEVLWSIPRAILLGIVPGLAVGCFLVWFFRKGYAKIRATEKALILLMACVLLVEVGDWVHGAALLGVMTVGFLLLEKEERVAHELSRKLAKMWIFAEIVLFVLIGISVDPRVAWGAGARGLLVLAIGLAFRSLGVWLSTLGSHLNRRERLFCVIAYFPKATVQAALGGVALSRGLPHGDTILALAVLSILFTAPLGLLGIQLFGQRLLAPGSSFGLPAPPGPGRVRGT